METTEATKAADDARALLARFVYDGGHMFKWNEFISEMQARSQLMHGRLLTTAQVNHLRKITKAYMAELV